MTRTGGTTNRHMGAPLSLLSDIEAELAINLAGRAAEQLIFGEVSGGSGGGSESDLARATGLALSLDTRLGLGAYGPVWMDLPSEISLRDPEVRTRIRNRIEAAEDRAHAILAAHRAHLKAMAETLLRERELAGEALAAWLWPVKELGGIESSGLGGRLDG